MSASARCILSVVLLASAAGAAASDIYLPGFKLDSMKASDMEVWQGPSVPKVPPPTDTGYDFRARKDFRRLCAAAPPDGRRAAAGPALTRELPLYDLFNYRKVRLTGGISLLMDAETGRAEIAFPAVEFEDADGDDRAELYFRLAAGAPSPQLSWAAVLCAGSRYLGYQGASFRLPERSGEYSIEETVALGSRKVLVAETHPWLASAGGKAPADPDQLCVAGFPKKMKDFRIRSLPARLGGYNFKYDAALNALKITWKTAP